MKIIIKFDIPEENSEAACALNGRHFHATLWDIDQKLRNLSKHNDLSKEMDDLCNEIRSMIMETSGYYEIE